MCRIMGKEKPKDEDKDAPFMSPAKQKMYELTMEALCMQADEMGEETIEAGRKSFEERLKMEGIEYNASTIGALKSGMEFMMLAQMKGQENGKDINVLALSVAAKLQKVEKDIEKAAKAAPATV